MRRPSSSQYRSGEPPTTGYWDEDGLRTGGTIVKFYDRYAASTFPFVPLGTVIASFDAGLRLRYHVYLQGPGEPDGAPVRITQKNGATVTGLRPGGYVARVVPANFRKYTGRGAKVTFTVP